MGAFAEKPVRAIAVDLPNLCIKTDPVVRMGGTHRPPLLLLDIIHLMRDLEAMELGVPIFYLIDHHVNPHAMTTVERQLFKEMENSDPSHPRKILRMRRLTSKADTALCALLNERSVAVLTEDGFRDEIDAGHLQKPHRMIRFHPVRDSREEPYRFVNMSHMIGGDLSTLVAAMDADEFRREWEACAHLLERYVRRSRFTGVTAGFRTRRSIRDRRNGTNLRTNDHGEATEDEIKEYLERSAETSRPGDTPNPIWARLQKVTVDVVDPAQDRDGEVPETTRETVRVRPRADAVFLFLKVADLRKHEGQHVEVIARAFVNNDVVQFRLYAAGLSLTLELKEQPAITTSHMFASATGLLEYDGRDWVLRGATWNGVVDNIRVQAVVRGVEPTEAPRFSAWGRWPLRARGHRPEAPRDVETDPIRPGSRNGSGRPEPSVDAAPPGPRAEPVQPPQKARGHRPDRMDTVPVPPPAPPAPVQPNVPVTETRSRPPERTNQREEEGFGRAGADYGSQSSGHRRKQLLLWVAIVATVVAELWIRGL